MKKGLWGRAFARAMGAVTLAATMKTQTITMMK